MALDADIKKEVRRAVLQDKRQVFFDAIEDIPHDAYYRDGELKVLADTNIIMFRRGSGKALDDGSWLSTNMVITGILSW